MSDELENIKTFEQKIESAAREAGVSVEEMKQRIFETIKEMNREMEEIRESLSGKFLKGLSETGRQLMKMNRAGDQAAGRGEGAGAGAGAGAFRSGLTASERAARRAAAKRGRATRRQQRRKK